MDDIKTLIKGLIKEAKRESYVLLDFPLLQEASILKEKYPFKAIFIFGPAGAGKTFLKNFIGLPTEFVDVSADERLEDIFKRFGISLKFAYDLPNTPENQRLEKAQLVGRKIAQAAARGHTEKMIFKGAPIIVDTTGEDVEEVLSKIDSLTHIGYDIGVMQINVPSEFSVQRDKNRERTIGKTVVGQISKQYQQDVVADMGYFTQFQARKNVTLFGNAIFPNIFCLFKDGCPAKNSEGEKITIGFGKYLPGITDDMVGQSVQSSTGDQVQPFKNATPQTSMKIAADIQADAQQFLSNAAAGPRNPQGRKIFNGMKALVKMSGGKLGQKWSDLLPALAIPEFAQNDHIVLGAQTVAEITGADIKDILGKERRIDTGEVAGSGGGPGRSPQVPTTRSAVKDMKALEEIVRAVLNEN